MITSRYLIERRRQLSAEMARYGIRRVTPPVRYVATYARTDGGAPLQIGLPRQDPRKAT